MLLFNFFFWTFIYKGTRYLSEKSKGLLKDWSTKDDSRILSFMLFQPYTQLSCLYFHYIIILIVMNMG